MIPEIGDVIAEISEFEVRLNDPRVEAYDNVSGCALTCKVCKACTCDESSDLK